MPNSLLALVALFVALFGALLGALACTEDSPDDGPFAPEVDALAADETRVLAGLRGAVRVVWDSRGVAHIYSRDAHDLAFVQGYVAATERWPQMDFGRRVATGTSAELAGVRDEGLIRSDIRVRALGIPAISEEAWETAVTGGLERSFLTGHAEGVNLFLRRWRNGEEALHPAHGLLFQPHLARDWEPTDSLAITKHRRFTATYGGRAEAELTLVIQGFAEAFNEASADPRLQARQGLARDLVRLTPSDPAVSVEDWAVSADGGDSSAKPDEPPRRPRLPRALLDRALRWLPVRAGASNAWVVSGERTASGHSLVASDPHLPLTSPSALWLTHLHLGDGGHGRGFNAAGVTVAGSPGVLIGHTEHLAWGVATTPYDDTDLYLEEVTPGEEGAPATVLFNGEQVPIESREEVIGVGLAGAVEESRSVTVRVDVVPHHGPVIPAMDPRDGPDPDGGSALSVRWGGAVATDDVGPLFALLRARDVAAAGEGLLAGGAGGPAYVLADTRGSISFLAPTPIPRRPAPCRTYHPGRSPEGLAPFLVMPGTGECEWVEPATPVTPPRATDPRRGFVVTANNDPTGQLSDGDPLSDGTYLGHAYDIGLRAGRITELLTAGGTGLSVDDMRRIQQDTLSALGRRLSALAVEVVREAEAGRHGLGEAATALGDRFARIKVLATILEGWDHETGPAAAAPSIFNAWWAELLDAATADDYSHAGHAPSASIRARSMLALLEHPGDVAVLDPATGESPVWDNLATPEVETRRQILLRAWDEALGVLEGLFPGIEDPRQWRWGAHHTLRLRALGGSVGGGDELDLPRDGGEAGRLERPGDNYAVNLCDPGFDDPDLSCSVGAAMRMVTEVAPGAVRATVSLPGGQVWDPESPHFDDGLAGWHEHRAEAMPFYPREVAAAAVRVVDFTP
jgi:penicillin amidase